MKKIAMMLTSIALVAAVAVGGTLAWLTAKTDAVVNTFTVGNIDIDLDETTTDYKMIPGNTINKDPKVTVKAGSEACWLFVKVQESNNLDDFITYTVDNTWTELETGVYYRAVDAVTADTSFAVLTSNQVTVKDTVTKTMLEGLTQATYPTLTFTAYAIQQSGFTTPAAAWAEASK